MDTVELALKEIEAHEPETVLSGINTALLLKVAEYIETQYDEFDMGKWLSNSEEQLGALARLAVRLGLRNHERYTVGCIACHTVRLGGGDLRGNVPAQAQRMLGLTDEQALKLFYVSAWPKRFRKDYQWNAKSPMDRAWIAGQYFRHFAATNGAV